MHDALAAQPRPGASAWARLLAAVLLLLSAAPELGAQSPACAGASEFCAGQGISYPAGTSGVPAGPGNDYGCLVTQPNPAWFYMSTNAAGGASINLAASQDIDFALWGPFNSFGDMIAACGGLGPPMSCSYSPSPTEVATLTASAPGQYFLLLITNFSGAAQNISGSSTSPILDCNACIAEGGVLSPLDQVACNTDLTPISIDQGGFVPDIARDGYHMVVVGAGGNISAAYPVVGNTWSPIVLGTGTFTVCGIGYQRDPAPPPFVGLNYNTLAADLQSADPPFCGDPSDNCVELTISAPSPPTFVIDSVCLGAQAPDCPVIAGVSVCAPGNGSVTLPTAGGCDSIVNYIVLPKQAEFRFLIDSVCANASPPNCPYIDGAYVCSPGSGSYSAPSQGAGCDTVVNWVVLPALGVTVVVVDSVCVGAAAPNCPLIGGTYVCDVGTGTIQGGGAGCDTTFVYDVRARSAIAASASGQVCANARAPNCPLIGGTYVCQPGTSTVRVAGSGGGCDTVISYTVTLAPEITRSVTAEVCANASAPDCPFIGGAYVCQPGTGSVRVTGSGGACDTVISYAVSLSPSLSVRDTVTVCDGSTYLYAGTAYTPGQTVVATLPGTGGACDSTLRRYVRADVLVAAVSPTAANIACGSSGVTLSSAGSTSGPDVSYSWTDVSGAVVGSGPTVSVARAGRYTLTVRRASTGCTATAAAAVTADQGETGRPTIQGPTARCPGESASYTATYAGQYAPYTFDWIVPAGMGIVRTAGGTLTADDLAVGTFSVCVAANGSCGPSDTSCVTLVVEAVVGVDAGGDQVVCGLETQLSAAASVGGTWSVAAGNPGPITFDDVGAASTRAAVDQAGRYAMVFTGTGACPGDDTVSVTFGDPLVLIEARELCAQDQQTLELAVTFSGGTAPYLATGMAGVISGTTFLSDALPASGAYRLTLRDALGCELEVSGTPACACASQAGTLPAGPVEVCVPELLNAGPVSGAAVPAGYVADYVLHDGSAGSVGAALATSSTGEFAFAPPLLPNVTYYVAHVVGLDDGSGVADPLAPCYAASLGRAVQWLSPAPAGAGPDVVSCLADTADLQASGSPGSWRLLDGGRLTGSPTTAVNGFAADVAGDYRLVWTTSAGTCTDADTVVASLAAAPSATFRTECDPGDTDFVLTLTAAGGTPPYVVEGIVAPGTGPVFAAVLPEGVPASFRIRDANGCASEDYTVRVDCDCTTRPPDFGPGAEVCVGETLTLGPATGGVNDGDDVDEYVLYEGSATVVNAELARSPVPTFAYAPQYQPDVVYHVRVERASADGAGGIQVGDPCRVASPGVPVVWRGLPTLTLADTTLCEGEPISVRYSLIGSAASEVAGTLAGMPFGAQLSTQRGQVALPRGGRLSLLARDLASGCEATDSVSAQITVVSAVPLQLSQPTSICNSTATAEPTTLVLAGLVAAGASTGTWSSADAPISAINDGVFDAEGLAVGTYTLTYSLPASGACPAQQASVRLDVRDCACPNLTILPPPALCATDGEFALADLLEEAQPGTWSIEAPFGGNVDTLLSGTQFLGTGALGGVYTLRFTLASPVAGCPDEAVVDVTIVDAPEAGEGLGDLETCEGSGARIELATLLSAQADSGGAWKLDGPGGLVSLGFDLDLATLRAGSYELVYTLATAAPCPSDEAAGTILVAPLPVAEAGDDRVLTCVDRSAELGVAATAGLSYSWRALPAGDTLGTVATLRVEASGTYELTVRDVQSGCSAVDLVEVVTTDEVPVVDVDLQPVSCAGAADASVTILGIEGGVGPYEVSFRGEPAGTRRSWSDLPAGNYDLAVRDANGCTAAPLQFTVTDPAPISVDAVANGERGSGEILVGDSVLLDAVILGGQSGAQVQWVPAEYVDCDTCAITYGRPPGALTYAVSVRTPEGCEDGDVIQVLLRDRTVVYFPTAISPNGDRVNDRFYVRSREADVERVRWLRVFDRWGELVYELADAAPNDPAVGWDGTFEGEPLNPQVLVFAAELQLRGGRVEIFTGDLALIR